MAENAKIMHKEPETSDETLEFSLVLGGPLYQLLLRTKLIRPPLDLLYRRVLACILITWLPLAILTVFAGTFSGGVNVPFIQDLTNIRLLLSLPLLIVAELIVHRRLRPLVEEFLDRGLIAPEDQQRYKSIVAWIMRLRNSIVIEVGLILLAFAGYWAWRTYTVPAFTTWYAIRTEASLSLTPSGYWFAFVSLPITRFLLIRWYFRLSLWYLFLWRVSRLKLRLNPLHPDRAGGIGFLDHSISAFSPILIAQSIFLASVIGSQILHEGKHLPDFKLEIAGFVIGLMILVLAPLTFFVFQMLEAKLLALREFGLLASRYSQEFRGKWLSADVAAQPELLGTSDIQSMADLANSFEVVRSMGVVPFDRHGVLRLAVLISLPMAPLVLTMIPLDELIEKLFKMLV